MKDCWFRFDFRAVQLISMKHFILNVFNICQLPAIWPCIICLLLAFLIMDGKRIQVKSRTTIDISCNDTNWNWLPNCFLASTCFQWVTSDARLRSISVSTLQVDCGHLHCYSIYLIYIWVHYFINMCCHVDRVDKQPIIELKWDLCLDNVMRVGSILSGWSFYSWACLVFQSVLL